MSKMSYGIINEKLREVYRDMLGVVNNATIPSISKSESSFQACEAIIIANRFGKGLWSRDASRAKLLQAKCLLDTFRTDDELHYFNSDEAFRFYGRPDLSFRFERIRRSIRSWVGPKPLGASKLELPPGETFLTSRGHTSIYRKMKGPWTVTEDCFRDFASIVFNTRWMRRIARERIEEKFSARYSELYKRAFQTVGTHVEPYLIFCILFRACCKIVPGSRFSSVPKDTEKRRPINVEPLGNMVVQRSLGLKLRERLSMQGNNLRTGQLEHQALIRDYTRATIDFSGASDSISVKLVELLFPKGWFTRLDRARSHLCDFGYNPNMFSEPPRGGDSGHFSTWAKRIVNERKQANSLARFTKSSIPFKGGDLDIRVVESGLRYENAVGRWKYLEKISSMGNGFTFEVLTTVLLATARSFDPAARVYGDDVIIDSAVADDFMSYCELLGFKVNTTKSFVNGRIRESCGTFLVDGQECLSYEFDEVSNVESLCIALNKMGLLIRHIQKRDYDPVLASIAQLLTKCRSEILRLARKLAYGAFEPPRRCFINDRWKVLIEGRFVQVLEHEDIPSLRLPKAVEESIVLRLKQLQYSSRYKLLRAYVPIDRVDSRSSVTVKDSCKLASYLYAGRRMDSIVRQDPAELKFRSVWLLSHERMGTVEVDTFLNGCFSPIG